MKNVLPILKTTALAALVFAFAQCQSEGEKSNPKTDAAHEQNEPITDRHTPRNSLDWSGIYVGVLPCGDCDGIETTLHLYRDETYKLITVYVGTPEDNEFINTGKFVWDAKEQNIELLGIEYDTKKFKVEEGSLLQLDQNGQIITGDLAEKYRLPQQ